MLRVGLAGAGLAARCPIRYLRCYGRPSCNQNAGPSWRSFLSDSRPTSAVLDCLRVQPANKPVRAPLGCAGVGKPQAQYDIEAKAPDGAFPAGLPTSEAKARIRAMLQTLLAERFKLVMRHDTREVSIYVLTIANGGPKLKASGIQEAECPLDPMDKMSCHQFSGGIGRGSTPQPST